MKNAWPALSGSSAWVVFRPALPDYTLAIKRALPRRQVAGRHPLLREWDILSCRKPGTGPVPGDETFAQLPTGHCMVFL
jgi:hypothetical protein